MKISIQNKINHLLKGSMLLLFAIVFMSNKMSAQDKVYISYFESINLDIDYEYSTTKLYKVYLEGTSLYSVILPEYIENSDIDFEKSKQEAVNNNAKYFIMGELNKVGSNIVVSISMYNSSDGSKFWSDYLKASDLDELEITVEALAKTTGTKMKAITKQANIIDNYSGGSNDFYAGVTIGGAISFLSSEIDQPMTGGIGAIISYDMDNLIFNLNGEIYSGEHTNLYFLQLNIIKPLKDSNPTTPYIEGGLGYGGVHIKSTAFPINDPLSPATHERTNSGLIPFLGGGYIFNRGKNVQLRTSLKGYYGTFDLLNNKNPYGAIFGLTIMIKN